MLISNVPKITYSEVEVLHKHLKYRPLHVIAQNNCLQKVMKIEVVSSRCYVEMLQISKPKGEG